MRLRLQPLIVASAVVLCGGRAMAAQTSNDECLGCHDEEDLTLALGNGKSVSLRVRENALAGSMHEDLECVDCHPAENEVPHPEKTFKNERELAIYCSENCKKCHFGPYTKTLDSVHFRLREQGRTETALCVDCHGAHDVSDPRTPRAKISQTCAKCHGRVYATYAKSVHGEALLSGNPDVPVCTDCHRAHDIVDPRTRDWRLAIPQLCGTCHTDPKRMDKYGISTKVLSTYLQDFHGATASLQRVRTEDTRVAAVCTDCHGIHDIQTTKGEHAGVMQKNLVNVCRRCHPGAPPNFPSAWLSHYEPSADKAPVVWAVKVFYYVFVPFVVIGLLLQIILHVWRIVVNR